MTQVTAALTAIVEGVIGTPIEASTPMMSAGLDSLAAVELRNMVQQRFAVNLSATAAFDYPTVQVGIELTHPAPSACHQVPRGAMLDLQAGILSV